MRVVRCAVLVPHRNQGPGLFRYFLMSSALLRSGRVLSFATGWVMPSSRWLAAKLSRRCWRSEEHTSELQSLMRISYAVFCLKKKTKKLQHTNIQIVDRTKTETTYNNSQQTYHYHKSSLHH